MNLREFIKLELKEFENNENYYGSKEQIESENFIVKESKIEMEYNECLEEYYVRILQTTK